MKKKIEKEKSKKRSERNNQAEKERSGCVFLCMHMFLYMSVRVILPPCVREGIEVLKRYKEGYG